MYMLFPIRKLYLKLIKNIGSESNSKNKRLIIYRLDKDNIFLTDRRNISGTTVGYSYEAIDSMSIKFYRYIEKSKVSNTLLINNTPLYQLYPRQVKLKLEGVLRSALRIKNFVNNSEENIEIVTDRQTASIMKEAFIFLNYTPDNLIWNLNGPLSLCITINSIFMRSFALIKMYISRSKLPSEYFYKHVSKSAPTVLITTPKNRPADFFSIYLKEFSNEFNIVLYGLGVLDTTPKNYKRIEFRRRIRGFRGIFKIDNLFWSSDSYIADILLIFKNHADLSMSIDVANSLFRNKIDAHISRCQTNAVDTCLAIEARRNGAYILGDIEEEIYYCDSAVCSSKAEHTESISLAIAGVGKAAYKNNNSMINYRIENYSNIDNYYFHKLLKLDFKKKIIFYASNPSKEERQRYLTEKWLINHFQHIKDFVLVIKTHPQDNGKITNYAYLDSSKPENVILIGDKKQERNIVSKKFNLFDDFDFNAAISSSDGFITASSSAILQAMMLDIKTGIIDMYNDGFYDYLINYKATKLINTQESLRSFLMNKKPDISDDILSHIGLKNNNEAFDIGTHLLECLKEVDQKNHIKKQTIK